MDPSIDATESSWSQIYPANTHVVTQFAFEILQLHEEKKRGKLPNLSFREVDLLSAALRGPLRRLGGESYPYGLDLVRFGVDGYLAVLQGKRRYRPLHEISL